VCDVFSQDGFRNVFKDDESSYGNDDRSLSASLVDSHTTVSNTSDDDYSTGSDEEATSRPNSSSNYRYSVTGKMGRSKKSICKWPSYCFSVTPAANCDEYSESQGRTGDARAADDHLGDSAGANCGPHCSHEQI
jgi:hypothetical protein